MSEVLSHAPQKSAGGSAMTRNGPNDSMIVERINEELAQRAQSDARLKALLADLYSAFNVALHIPRGNA